MRGSSGPRIDPVVERAPSLAPRGLLAVLAAVLGSISCIWTQLWPLALVAQVPLLLGLRGLPARRAAGLGLLGGFVTHVIGFYWLGSAVVRFTGVSTAAAWALAGLVLLFQGGRQALAAWLFARAVERGWWQAPAFLAAFVTSELCYPQLFPSYYAMAAQGAPLLMQTAELGGPLLVSAVLISANLAAAELAAARIEGRQVQLAIVAIFAAIPAAAIVYGLVRMPMIDAQVATSRPVQIGIVQGNQPVGGSEPASVALLRQRLLTQELVGRGAELVIWSEGAVRPPLPERAYRRFLPDRVSSFLKVPAILGVEIFAQGARDQHRYNSVLATDADGSVRSRYDKHLLVPFAEYVPLEPLLGPVVRQLSARPMLAAGPSLEPLTVVTDRPHRVTALICYEAIFAGFTRELVVRHQPELLVNLSNDAWFGDTVEPWEHLHLAQLRAVEHRRFLVRATNSGVSAIVDPVGRLRLQGSVFRAEALRGEVRWMEPSAKTGYELLGDAPFVLVALAALGMTLIGRRVRD